MSDNMYFTVEAGSPAADRIATYSTSIETQRTWVRKFEKRHDLTNTLWVAYNQASIIGFAPKPPAMWSHFLEAHPLWRRVFDKGCDYAVPRKVGAEAKALDKEWQSRPRIVSTDHIKTTLTSTDWDDWLKGMTGHGMGWRILPDESYIVVIPYFVTKAKAFKPMQGLSLGADQSALRDLWHTKEKKE
jgi:hypothetical protein